MFANINVPCVGKAVISIWPCPNIILNTNVIMGIRLEQLEEWPFKNLHRKKEFTQHLFLDVMIYRQILSFSLMEFLTHGQISKEYIRINGIFQLIRIQIKTMIYMKNYGKRLGKKYVSIIVSRERKYNKLIIIKNLLRSN